jgi:two-component system phosphate regulon sensor histidine kinase PhoR
MDSHQFRSTLSSMRWELEALLAQQADGQEETHLALKNVYKNNLRLIDLVNKLLNISRIENKKSMDKPTKIDVVAMVNSILKDSAEKIEEAELEVRVTAPSQLTVQYDENILREVLSNLIVNAIKFNKKRGIIIIELEKDSSKWTFHIANTGKPISKTDGDHLFEKFFRGSNASDETPGTGLGLYITYQYVSKWNGVVTFISPAHFGEKSIRGTKNSGTIFKVELPVSSQ